MSRFFVRSLAAITVAGLASTLGFFNPDTAAVAAPGPLSGTVFRDINANGVKDASTATPTAVDSGQAGVTVQVFDPTGAQVATTTSAATGAWSITPSADGPYRIEFSNQPFGMEPTSAGAAGKNTAVQFAPAAGGTGFDIGYNLPSEYCQDNPDIATNCYVFGPYAANNNPVVVSFPYNAGTVEGDANPANVNNPTTHNIAIAQAQVGSTWGLAYQRNAKTLYMSAFAKKHSGYGPAGTGAIYAVNRSAGTSALSTFANVNTLFGAGTAGADTHNPIDYNRDNGNTTWDAVGKTSFGGMDVSDDDQRLYAMNLADRQLYSFPLDTTPTAANVKRQPIPLSLPSCPSTSDARPFAVQYFKGKVYVGIVCSAESTQSRADLRAYVYTADPVTLAFSTTPVLNMPLNYGRGVTNIPASANWLPWRSTFNALAAGNGVYRQPIFSDLVFDGENMIIGLRDRAADQFGNYTLDNPNDNVQYHGISAGDTLRACGSIASGWTPESNGTCGGVTTSAFNNQGPGGGEYYYRDEFFSTHSEVSLGGLAQVPGFSDVMSTVFDPATITDWIDDGGVRRWRNSNGTLARLYRLFDGITGPGSSTFGKANGLGDLVALCDAAPVEIGSRMWNDANKNGLQDAGEAALPGVTVELWKAGVRVGTAVTDAAGNYRFTSLITTDATPGDSLGGGVIANTAFEIRVPNAVGGSQQVSLAGLQLTGTNLGAKNSIDSDALLSGVNAAIALTTGAAGANNHTYDIGFTPAPKPEALGFNPSQQQ
jgi:hypothetical protein